MKITDVKKKFFKANQFIGEKMGLTQKNIKYEEDLQDLEKKCESIGKVLAGLSEKTEEYVQPNAAMRMRLKMRDSIDKMKGLSRENKHPQIESVISNFLLKNSKDVPTNYGNALETASSYFGALSDSKDTFENEVIRGTLEPISVLKETDLKDISKCKKRLESRRLELESVKRRRNAPENEVEDANFKFENIIIEAYNTYMEFAENKEELFVQQLFLFAKAIKNYHQSCTVIAEEMEKALESIYIEAKHKTKKQAKSLDFSRQSQTTMHSDSHSSFSLKDADSFDRDIHSEINVSDSYGANNDKRNGSTHFLQALFDFDPEANDELPLKAGDMIKFISDIDENWIEGEVHGQRGIFPRNFVKDMP